MQRFFHTGSGALHAPVLPDPPHLQFVSSRWFLPFCLPSLPLERGCVVEKSLVLPSGFIPHKSHNHFEKVKLLSSSSSFFFSLLHLSISLSLPPCFLDIGKSVGTLLELNCFCFLFFSFHFFWDTHIHAQTQAGLRGDVPTF